MDIAGEHHNLIWDDFNRNWMHSYLPVFFYKYRAENLATNPAFFMAIHDATANIAAK